MNHTIKNLIFLILILFAYETFGQNLVKGIVINNALNKPIKDVTVKIKNSPISCTTDSLGKFQIEVPIDKNVELVIKKPGFGTKVVNSNIDSILIIRLNRSGLELQSLSLFELREHNFSEKSYCDTITFRKDTLSNTKNFTVVEQMPEYPGGEACLTSSISKNIITSLNYSLIPKSTDISVFFCINQLGLIDELDVFGDLPISEINKIKEAFKKLKTYRPGISNGKFVNVYYSIRFRI